ncbi:MAG: sugar ABC transporter permease [Geminicoccaceae bacterium]
MRKSGLGWTIAFFIAPAMILLVCLNVIPFVYALYMSFYNWSLAKPGPPNFLGWFNYEDLLVNERFINSLKVSASFVVLAVSIELVLGLALAFLFSARVRGMATLRKWSIAPVMVTPLVAGLVWFYMFNETYGTITWFAYELGLGRVPFFTDDRLALLCIVIADAWQWTPLVMLILFAALQAIPEYVYEAGRMDGLSERQMLRRITLPLLRPAIVVVLILRVTDSLRNLELVFMMTRGGPGGATETLPWYIYSTGFVNQDLGSAAAMAVVMVIMVTILSQFMVRQLRYREG